MNTIIDNIDIWTTAQTPKTSGRGNRADNQQLLGIQKLRELILELAVRGKLVPQDPNDEPASLLLKKIAAEKKRQIKNGEIKKTKSLPEIEKDERPFDLPKGWIFERLNEIGDWGAGATPNRSKPEYYGGKIPWFKSGELNGDYISESEEFVTDLALKETSLRYNKIGDVLIAMYGATIGKTSILKIPATTNQAVCACTPFEGIYNVFLLTLLKAYKSRFTGMGAGGAQPNISREKIIATVVALPPFAEQHRIMAKVGELMALCDQLEHQQNENNQLHQTLVETLLVNLTQAASLAEQAEAWQRIANNFDTLFTTEYSIDQLKQTILQLAVMGKLVPQDPADEPASELLKKIAKEKARLVKEGKIKKQASLPEITDDEKPFELPKGWEWTRFSEFWQDSFYGPRFGNDEYVSDGGYPTIRTTDMTSDGFIELKSPPCVNVKDNKLELYRLEKGDLLITRSGSIGTMALYDLDIEALPSAYLIRVRLSKDMLPAFVLRLLMSPMGLEYLGLNTTSVGVPNVNATKMASFVLPLPPLAEQSRIVAKVNELFALCDALKERLAQAQTSQNLLAGAVVAHALATKPAGKMVYATPEQVNLAAEPE